MARIRSIKPQYFNHEKIDELSHGCALFFIGLWCHCDDEGKIKDSPKQLSLLMPRFRKEDIQRWVSDLLKMKLLRRGYEAAPVRLDSGSGAAWLRVTGWSHQKISRPHDAEVKVDEITWIIENDSLNDPERSVNKHCKDKDRIGKDKDRIGERAVALRRVRSPQPVASEGDLSLATQWLEFAGEEMPWRKDSWTAEKFAEAIAKVRAKTDLNEHGITELLKFIRTDDFWRRNAISPASLLNMGKNGLRKVDSILAQMKPKEDSTDRALRNYAADQTPLTDELPF